MMSKEVGFSWNSGEEDDQNNILVNSSSSSSSALVNIPFSFWSDVIQPPQLPSEQHQQQPPVLQLQQQQEYDPNVGLALHQVLDEAGGESSSRQQQLLESAHLMNQTHQVTTTTITTGGISIGRPRTDTPATGSSQQNKRLKSAAHNISEKRRRDKFKERIKTLQQLLPDCDKGDIASVLDEAIKQIRLLKFEVQWLQEQYTSSTIHAVSPSPMVPYPAMLHYPAPAVAAGVCPNPIIPPMQLLPQMQIIPYFTPQRPLLPFSHSSSPSYSIASAPRGVDLAPNPTGPPTQVVARSSGLDYAPSSPDR